jgi:hypothetical protein
MPANASQVPRSLAVVVALLLASRSSSPARRVATARPFNGLSNEPTDNWLGRMPGYDPAARACRNLVDDPANNDPANK